MENGREYFLGIQGKQTGPFSEDQVADLIRQKKVPKDAMVWYEGLPEWAEILTIEYFKPIFEEGPATLVSTLSAPPPRETPAPTEMFTSLTAPPSGETSASSNSPAPAGETNFDTDRSSLTPLFATRARPQRKNYASLGLVAGSVVVIGFILFTYFPFLWQGDKNRKKFVKKKIVPVLSIAEQRAQTLQKANMDLLTNPEQALEQLKKLAIENPQDTIGKEAIQIFTDKLRRTEREPAIGDLLVQVKQPVEALKYLPITTSADVREKAVFMAFEMGKEEKEKRLYLSEDIRLWLIKLNNEGKALERIKLYEKTFPKEPNPFAYYLKTDEQKLVDIFRRISSFFSSTLKMYIDMEFPGIQFKSLPIVEVRKDKTNLYRISANYEGDIFLRKDSLSKIKFTFWFIDDHWQVVETNLTPERKSYAAEQFTKWSGKKLPLKAMLSFLEKTFQAQYPDLLLYEEVPSRDLSRKNEKE